MVFDLSEVYKMVGDDAMDHPILAAGLNCGEPVAHVGNSRSAHQSTIVQAE